MLCSFLVFQLVSVYYFSSTLLNIFSIFHTLKKMSYTQNQLRSYQEAAQVAVQNPELSDEMYGRIPLYEALLTLKTSKELTNLGREELDLAYVTGKRLLSVYDVSKVKDFEETVL